MKNEVFEITFRDAMYQGTGKRTTVIGAKVDYDFINYTLRDFYGSVICIIPVDRISRLRWKEIGED